MTNRNRMETSRRCKEGKIIILGILSPRLGIGILATLFLAIHTILWVVAEKSEVSRTFTHEKDELRSILPRPVVDYDGNRQASSTVGSHDSIHESPVNPNNISLATSFYRNVVSDGKSAITSTTQSVNNTLTKSPYEVRMPRMKLPEWAIKPAALRNVTVSKNQELCFVHIGKTAGSTIGCALGFRLHCFDDKFFTGLLPVYTTHIYHGVVNDCPFDTTKYLIAIRHPLFRIKSVHIYERPSINGYNNEEMGRNKIYQDCPFRTLNDLAENGLDKNGNASEICRERAYKHIRGLQQFGYHAFHNYKYFVGNLDWNNSTRVYIVRTEHLMEDWNRLEQLIGGEQQKEEQFKKFNPSGYRAIEGDDYLSEKALTLLCEALCEEILVYRNLLDKAVNLNEQDVAISYEELAATCPRESRISSCTNET